MCLNSNRQVKKTSSRFTFANRNLFFNKYQVTAVKRNQNYVQLKDKNWHTQIDMYDVAPTFSKLD